VSDYTCIDPGTPASTRPIAGPAPLVVWLSQFPADVPACTLALFHPEEQGAVMEGQMAGWLASPPHEPPALVAGGLASSQLVLLPVGPADFLARDHAARSVQMILGATRYAAQELGAHRLVLGSLTSSVTRNGVMVADYVDRHNAEHPSAPWPLKITTGNSGTLGVLRSFLAELLPGRDTVVAIVGLGNLGKGLLGLLVARRQRRVLVFGRSQASLERALAGMPNTGTQVVASPDVPGRLREAHLVVTLTSSPSAVVHPEHLDAPTVVVDPSLPYAVVDDPGWRAGGHVVCSHAGQLAVGANLDVPSWRWAGRPGTLYSCLAEGAASAIADGQEPGRERHHHVGEPDLAHAAWFEAQRAALGWGQAPTCMFDQPVSVDEGRVVLARRLVDSPELAYKG